MQRYVVNQEAISTCAKLAGGGRTGSFEESVKEPFSKTMAGWEEDTNPLDELVRQHH